MILKAKAFSTIAVVAVLLIVVIAPMSSTHAENFSKTLKFASAVPPDSFFGKYQQWWAKEVEKRTSGRVTFDFYWMESLVKYTEMLHGLKHGMCDVAVPASTYHPSELPLFMMVDNPYNVEDYWAAMMAVLDAQDNEPGLKAELEKQGIYYLAPYVSGYDFIHAKKPFNSLAEVKGKTFRTYGGAKIEMLKYLDLNPVFMPYTEIYEAIDRGTIFGNADASLQISDAFKHQEIAKFAYLTNYSCSLGTGIAIGRKVFNKLPQDIQGTLLDLQKEAAAKYAYDIMQVEDEIKKRWASENGVLVRDVSPEDDKRCREAGEKTTEFFIQQQEDKGHPARKTWIYFQAAQEKYLAEVKEKGYPWESK